MSAYERFLACLQSCFPGPQRRNKAPTRDMYQPLLLEDEKDAVSYLLHCLHTRDRTKILEGEALRAITILSQSNNVDLQRSAAITIMDVTTEMDAAQLRVDAALLEPVISLAHSSDAEVQRASSAALANFAVHGFFFLLCACESGTRHRVCLTDFA